MKIGFTGTQKGMTESQRIKLLQILPNNSFNFHHGDCIGADTQAHVIVDQLRKNLHLSILIHTHPSTIEKKRAYNTGDFTNSVKEPLLRNKDIVNETDLLIACPKGFIEKQRSGTWSTIRYARKVNKKVIIIYPNGDINGDKNV